MSGRAVIEAPSAPAIDEPTVQPGRDWRLFWTLGLLIVLAAGFWLTSRYPSLNRKALVANNTATSGALGFDVLVEVRGDDGLFRRLSGTAVNWLWSNRQGMAFGIGFGAVLLTALTLIKRRAFESSLANTAVGVLIGAPLGVCVNCAAPISHALRRGGARSETALAAMFSSPTYNVIVVSIAFTILPTYMVVTKLVLTLLFILIGVPLLTRSVTDLVPLRAPDPSSKRWSLLPSFALTAEDESGPDTNLGLGPVAALWWVTRTVVRNLWEIGRLAIPLMVVASIAGSIMVTLLPFEELIDLVDTNRTGFMLIGLLVITTLGLILPLPIAFDVVVAGALWAAGFPASYVMALFFTLGVYSVYSALVVRQVFSKTLAWKLAIPLIALGMVSGLGAGQYQDWREAQSADRIDEALSTLGRAPEPVLGPAPDAQETTALRLAVSTEFALADTVVVSGDVSELEVTSTPFVATAGESATQLERVVGTDIGFDDRERSHPSKNLYIPFQEIGGAAVGDVHGDGWDDVAVTTDAGVVLYANVGGSFRRQEVAEGALLRGTATNVMLVDLDTDGDLDLIAAYADGTVLQVENSAGTFESGGVVELPRHADPAAMVNAFAVADIDLDGDLDIAVGWWAVSAGADNHIWRQRPDGSFDVEVLPGRPAHTLTILLSDLTGDGWPDLLVGNDFRPHDLAYENDGEGGFQPNGSLLPQSTQTTMSYTLADFDGDLANELYIGQIGRPDDEPAWAEGAQGLDSCSNQFSYSAPDRCVSSAEAATRLQQMVVDRSMAVCLDLRGVELETCLVSGINLPSNDNAGPERCESIEDLYPEIAEVCRRGFTIEPTDRTQPDASLGEVQSVRQRNFLIDLGTEGDATTAPESALSHAGWTWDASAIDLENDGDLDLAVVNGVLNETTQTTNVVFLNEPDGFVASTYDIGFGDHAPTTGSVIFDVDNDGDADILTVPVDGPVNLYRNTGPTGSSIELEFLLDIPTAGTVVMVTAGENTYRYDIVIGGGYTSFDSSRILAGLGDYDGPVEVDITWPNGRTTRLDGLLPGSRYRVSS